MICIEKKKYEKSNTKFSKEMESFFIFYTHHLPSLQKRNRIKNNNTLLFRFVSNFYSPEEKSRKLDDRNAFERLIV